MVTAAFADDRAPSASSLLAAAIAAPTSAAELDACSSAGSVAEEAAAALSSDADTLAGGASLVLGGRRVSPASPSYDETHARFSHVGAHALDVFFLSLIHI